MVNMLILHIYFIENKINLSPPQEGFLHLNYTLLTSSATTSAASFPFKFHPVIDVDKLQLVVVP
ncbi:hypothetical protein Xszus_01252 [Xenorhabdus szentirmaii]|nr:hypothetical protein Xsze_02879 [Xenorhabdus szentirmaii DSM 16338]PHM41559.1 hypothetical protein Xszus_01252 [Xenorhabdus szentirmaii]